MPEHEIHQKHIKHIPKPIPESMINQREPIFETSMQKTENKSTRNRQGSPIRKGVSVIDAKNDAPRTLGDAKKAAEPRVRRGEEGSVKSKHYTRIYQFLLYYYISLHLRYMFPFDLYY